MEGNLTVESDYREMMKRWLYDFLFEKVIVHAKYLNPVQFSCGLITHPKGRKRKSAFLSPPVQGHFQPKKTRTASTLAIAMQVAEHYGSPIKIRICR
jgi:hypothetical protein